MAEQRLPTWKENHQIQQVNLSSEEEWFNFRCGKLTASDIWKIMGGGRKKGEFFSQTGKTYLLQNIAEIITGEQKRLDNIKAFQWGKAYEPFAMDMLRNMGYDFEYYGGHNPVFFSYNKYSGSSPDGLSTTHVFEAKCPYNKENHIENWLASKKENPVGFLNEHRYEYLIQIYFNMLCTGRRKAYFVSYDPRPLELKHRIAIIEVPPDNNVLVQLQDKIEAAAAFIRESLGILYYE